MINKVESCLATVISGTATIWLVKPLIIESDGTDHPIITVTVRDGMTPTPGDTVLVTFMKNNLNLEPQNRVFNASESNGVIIGVLDTSVGYFLTGDYTFIGNLTLLGNFTMTGTFTLTGDAIINGVSFNAFHAATQVHTHANNAPTPGPTGPPLPPIP